MRSRERSELQARQYLALYACLAFLYAAMSTSQEKTVFQGNPFYPFYLPLAIAAVHAVAHLLALLRRKQLGHLITPPLSAMLGLFFAILPLASDYTDTPPATPSIRALNEIADLAQAYASQCGVKSVTITTLNPQPLSGEAVMLALAQRGVHARHSSLAFDHDRAAFLDRARDSDFAVLPSAYPDLDKRMPSYPFLEEGQRLMLASPDRSNITIRTPGDIPIQLSWKTCT